MEMPEFLRDGSGSTDQLSALQHHRYPSLQYHEKQRLSIPSQVCSPTKHSRRVDNSLHLNQESVTVDIIIFTIIIIIIQYFCVTISVSAMFFHFLLYSL